MYEPPREYYSTLRKTYFQRLFVPESQDNILKSLFLHNFHATVRFDKALHCRTENLSMTRACRYSQLVWEMHVCPVMEGEETKTRVLNIRTGRKQKQRLKFSSSVIQLKRGWGGG